MSHLESLSIPWETITLDKRGRARCAKCGAILGKQTLLEEHVCIISTKKHWERFYLPSRNPIAPHTGKRKNANTNN